ncbi:hypothetical protein BGZ76_006119 [Entomortierella beljakovae]|nr:hypothetical protein BGZ76_006119 [Entomortierella beljakovae]
MNAAPLPNLGDAQVETPSSKSTFKKAKKSPPYAWQLLPQEELDSIAYHSRKQRKARLLENPPICPNCPNVRLTSMAMLATHMTSKKHLVRAKKQAEEGVKASGHDTKPSSTSSSITTTQPLQSVVSQEVANLQPTYVQVPELPSTKSSISGVMNMDLDTDSGSNNNIQSAAPSCVLGNFTPVQSDPKDPMEQQSKSSKQRKRKAERDYKKAKKSRLKEVQTTATNPVVEPLERVQLDSKSTITSAATNTTPMPVLESPSKVSVSSNAPKKKRLRTRKKNPKSGVREETLGDGIMTYQKQEGTKENTSPSQDEPVSHSMVGLEVSKAAETKSEAFRYCTICKGTWKQEKAWQSHLLSAQHARRVLKAMQKIAPKILPYGVKDVLASKDPFGWGTGTGVVENEEEEDEEEEEEEKEEEGNGNEIALNEPTHCNEEGGKLNNNVGSDQREGSHSSNDDMDLGE